VFDILSDMLRPALEEGEFTTEKKVILEEIALYKDRPTHVLFERTIKEFFGTNPAGNLVLGSTDSVSALTPEAMRGYFESRYSPANIVLAVSGNFDWPDLLLWQKITAVPGRALRSGESLMRYARKIGLSPLPRPICSARMFVWLRRAHRQWSQNATRCRS